MATQTTTLYLRGMPTQVVREAKAAAARRGSTLASFVADALARRLAGVEALAETPDEGLTAEMAWYEANRASLVSAYAGEYVAIVEGAVVDHDRDFSALAARAFARFGLRGIYMPRVLGQEPAARLRSPRRARA
jgi:hypothetical protein